VYFTLKSAVVSYLNHRLLPANSMITLPRKLWIFYCTYLLIKSSLLFRKPHDYRPGLIILTRK